MRWPNGTLCSNATAAPGCGRERMGSEVGAPATFASARSVQAAEGSVPKEIFRDPAASGQRSDESDPTAAASSPCPSGRRRATGLVHISYGRPLHRTVGLLLHIFRNGRKQSKMASACCAVQHELL